MRTSPGFAVVLESNGGSEITVHSTEARARTDMLNRFLAVWEMGEITNHTLTRHEASWRSLSGGTVTLAIERVVIDEDVTKREA